MDRLWRAPKTAEHAPLIRALGYHADFPAATSRRTCPHRRLRTDEGHSLPYIALGGMKGAVFPCELLN